MTFQNKRKLIYNCIFSKHIVTLTHPKTDPRRLKIQILAQYSNYLHGFSYSLHVRSLVDYWKRMKTALIQLRGVEM